MKKLGRFPEKFDVFDLYVKLAEKNNIKFNSPNSINDYLYFCNKILEK